MRNKKRLVQRCRAKELRMKRTVRADEDGMLLLAILRGKLRLSQKTLRGLKAMDGGITVNGKQVTVRYTVHEGDEIELKIEDSYREGSAVERIMPRALPFKLVYRDEFITISNKPAHMPTHPSHGHTDDTLANALAFLAQKRGEPFVFRPLTRLDGDTSGLVLSANDRLSASRLFAAMGSGRIKKTYIAIVKGRPSPSEGVIDAPIERADTGILMRTVREDGKPSKTEYRVVDSAQDGSYSLVILRPLTGRTHQIRVHLSHIGCPILGDFLYGERSEHIDRHALHAARLELEHPEDGRLIIATAPLPDDFFSAYETLIRSKK